MKFHFVKGGELREIDIDGELEDAMMCLGRPDSTNAKRPGGNDYVAWFDKAGVSVGYDVRNKKINYIEITAPSELMDGKFDLLSATNADCKNHYESHISDSSCSGFMCKEYGLGIYSKGYEKTPQAPIESVLIFRPNYWETH